ncbi:Rv1733c family protein [Nocardia neocaledoniensis]|uniref:Rv1733c family protein n=1 Tax=Nocardia neocaledoniensis TaxID=236511 RepID=UPI003F4CE8B9
MSRWWSRRPWSRNPLMRPSDRWESALWLLLAAVVLMAIPVAGAVGTASYSAAGERLRHERAHLTSVTATIRENPVRSVTIGARGYAVERYTARVAWSAAGRDGTAVVDTSASASAGDSMVVWLSGDGRPVSAPAGPGATVSAGISAGVVTLCTTVGGALVIAWGARQLLDRRRGAAWSREWERIDRARTL